MWSSPAETCVYDIPSVKGGMSHWPWSFFPQATALPSLRRSTVWWWPAETCVYECPASKGGSLHCKKKSVPQLRKPQQSRHLGEEQCDPHLQKPGRMSFLELKVECYIDIVLWNSIRKPQHGHRFGEARCGTCLQQPLTNGIVWRLVTGVPINTDKR